MVCLSLWYLKRVTGAPNGHWTSRASVLGSWWKKGRKSYAASLESGPYSRVVQVQCEAKSPRIGAEMARSGAAGAES